jgi:hypothetical protein
MSYPTMLVGQVAQAAGVPRETLRVWLRRDLKEFIPDRPKGWKRFTTIETIVIILYASFLRSIRDHDLAEYSTAIASTVLFNEWTRDGEGHGRFHEDTFAKDRMMFLWRDAEGKWAAQIHDTREGIHGAVLIHIDHTYEGASGFIVINIGEELRRALASMLTVLAEIDDEQEDPE